jgi:putative transposase
MAANRPSVKLVYGTQIGRHLVFMLHAHLVFTTKRRGKVLSNEHLQRLETIVRHVGANFEVELGEFNGQSDHAPLLVS